MTPSEIVGAISDCVVAVAAIIGVVLAWRGLTTWRDQLRGTAEYELARSLLRDIYRWRGAIQWVRNSFMSSAEMPQPEAQEAETMDRDEIRYYGLSKAYQARWNQVSDVRRELDPRILEAEVLWGAELKHGADRLKALEHELFIAIRNYLELNNPAVDEPRKQALEGVVRKRRDIMYDTIEGEDNFAVDYQNAIQGIEARLRPHLRRP